MLRHGTLRCNGTLVLKAKENTGFINRPQRGTLIEKFTLADGIFELLSRRKNEFLTKRRRLGNGLTVFARIGCARIYAGFEIAAHGLSAAEF